jgi:hypothetical protein
MNNIAIHQHPQYVDEKFKVPVDGEWMTLEAVIKQLQQMQKRYGRYSLLNFDAGYNNVSAKIKPSKKQNQ